MVRYGIIPIGSIPGTLTHEKEITNRWNLLKFHAVVWLNNIMGEKNPGMEPEVWSYTTSRGRSGPVFFNSVDPYFYILYMTDKDKEALCVLTRRLYFYPFIPVNIVF